MRKIADTKQEYFLSKTDRLTADQAKAIEAASSQKPAKVKTRQLPSRERK